MPTGLAIARVLLLAAWMLFPLTSSSQDGQLTSNTMSAALGEFGLSSNGAVRKFARRPVQASRLLARFYEERNYAPAWVGGNLEQARTVLEILRSADRYGLIPADYALTVPAFDGKANDPELARFDIELSHAILQLMADLHFGRISPDFAIVPSDMKRSTFDPAAHLQASLGHDMHEAVARAEPRIALYGRVKKTLAHYRALAPRYDTLVAVPAPSRGVKLHPGTPYAGATQLAARLAVLGDLDDTGQEAEPGIYTARLADGLKHFQLRHGLEEDGLPGPATLAALAVPLEKRIRQLELTLERLRWLPPIPAGPLIVVNIPAFRLWAFEAGTRAAAEPLEMRVIVGKAARTPTPLFIGQMRYLEFNPYWNVPRSIELGEVVPKLARDPAYLSKNAMEVVSGKGVVQDGPASALLASLRAGTARVRQRPGSRNVLGAVKFAMPNPMNIYLHSTSSRELFGKMRRDLSHGCIRVERPAELAEFVLARQGAWNLEQVKAAMEPGPTRTVRLDAPIPVILSYATATTDLAGRALFAADIYKRDDKLGEALTLP